MQQVTGQEAARKGILKATISVVVNTLLFVLKFWAGVVSGSVALIADAWHTLSDSATSLVVLVGIKLSRKKPTQSHPFGFGRWEQITALICGFILAVVAYQFTTDAIERLRDNTAANFGIIAIVVTLFSILVKEGLAQYAFWVYRKTGFVTMKAEGVRLRRFFPRKFNADKDNKRCGRIRQGVPSICNKRHRARNNACPKFQNKQ